MAKRRGRRRSRGRRRGRSRGGRNSMQLELVLVFGLGLIGWLAIRSAPRDFTPLVELITLMVYLLALVVVVIAGLKLYKVWRKVGKLSRLGPRPEIPSSSASADTDLTTLDPFSLERKVAEVYQRKGFHTSVLPGGATTPLSLELTDQAGAKIAVGLRRHATDRLVELNEVLAFFGAMVGTGYVRGIMVTTSKFSEEAKEFAADKNIELVDGMTLAQLTKQLDTI